jgi:hypothetical protein
LWFTNIVQIANLVTQDVGQIVDRGGLSSGTHLRCGPRFSKHPLHQGHHPLLSSSVSTSC